MYQLSLKKINKKITPYFSIKLKNDKSKQEKLLYSENLLDLEKVLIDLKKTYNKRYKEVINSNKQLNSYVNISSQYKGSIFFKIEVESKKVIKKIKRTLTDEEIETRINNEMISELEMLHQFYEDILMFDNYEEVIYNPIYKRVNSLNIEKELIEFSKSSKADNLEGKIKKEVKKIKNKYSKNKEKYREEEISEVCYENSIAPLLFEIKYFNEKKEEFEVEIKEISELLESF